MKQTNENASQVEAQDQDVIVLGTASVETQGTGGSVESTGKHMGSAISEE
jgi:hypothetical protein